ncbi:MAG: DUF2716 domain-containing protein, partial [Kineothrix sp.]|nr:DUF2716 domain-containing protein [Kineothrix sp.]
MEIISDYNKYNAIWDKIYYDFQFYPSCETNSKPWLSLSMKYKKYHLNGVFTEEQEKIINSIFCRVNATNMYALDWRH